MKINKLSFLLFLVIIFSITFLSFGQEYNDSRCHGKILGWTIWNNVSKTYTAYSMHEGLSGKAWRELYLTLPEEANGLSVHELIIAASIGYPTNPGVGWHHVNWNSNQFNVDCRAPELSQSESGQWTIRLKFFNINEYPRYLSMGVTYKIPHAYNCKKISTGATKEQTIKSTAVPEPRHGKIVNYSVDCMTKRDNQINAYFHGHRTKRFLPKIGEIILVSNNGTCYPEILSIVVDEKNYFF